MIGKDIDLLVIAPLESMLKIVQTISRDPMAKLGSHADFAEQVCNRV